MDEHGDFALDLALKNHFGGIALNLVEHGVDLDRLDEEGKTLLHKAISRGFECFRLLEFNIKIQLQLLKCYLILFLKKGDEFSARFLIENNCDVNAFTKLSRETALHFAATHESNADEESEGICKIAELLIEYGCKVNAQDHQN